MSRIVCQPNLNLEDANLQDRTNRLLRRPITPHIEIPFHSMAYYASLRRNTLELIHQENRIYAENDAGKVIAEVTFPQENDSTVCLDHTFVDDSLRGQGVAGKLVKEVVDYAQKNGKKIRPQCSYAADWFNKHSEYADLVAH